MECGSQAAAFLFLFTSLPRQRQVTRTFQILFRDQTALLCLFHSDGWKLLCAAKSASVTPFVWRSCALFHFPYPVSPFIATLTKTTGVCTDSSHIGTRCSSLWPEPIALCFHTLTNCLFRKPFVLIFMYRMGGVGGGRLQLLKYHLSFEGGQPQHRPRNHSAPASASNGSSSLVRYHFHF